MKVRAAAPGDVEHIVRIIAHYASQGLMLPRSVAALSEGLDRYVVADNEGTIVGCGGFDVYTRDSAELYGLATAPEIAPKGTGRAVVEALIAGAQTERLSRLFALTLAPRFFMKMGFERVFHSDLPLKVWRDCVACPKYGNCDETAMVLDLKGYRFSEAGGTPEGRVLSSHDIRRQEIVFGEVREFRREPSQIHA